MARLSVGSALLSFLAADFDFVFDRDQIAPLTLIRRFAKRNSVLPQWLALGDPSRRLCDALNFSVQRFVGSFSPKSQPICGGSFEPPTILAPAIKSGHDVDATPVAAA